jgi:DNA-binding CsgD family transcriptional regulator
MNKLNHYTFTVSGLPQRQGEVLLHTACGRTRKEAAKLMGCSPKNAEQLLDAVRHKLHARTAPEAVATAFQRGILRSLAAVLILSSFGAFLQAPAEASDDDPMVRRVRSRPSGRQTRRVRSGDCLADVAASDLFIQFYNLQPVIVWDDGLYLTYE